MRWLVVALLILVSTALATTVDVEGGVTVERNIGPEIVQPIIVPLDQHFRVHVKAEESIFYTYGVEDNTLLLRVGTYKDASCTRVDVSAEKEGKNRFEVYVRVYKERNACAAVVRPELVVKEIRLELDPAYRDVYVEIEREGKVQELPPEFPHRITQTLGEYTVFVEVSGSIGYDYTIEENTLKLFLSSWRGTPCTNLRVSWREVNTNEFEVRATLEQNGICIQVVPPSPATAEVNLPLDPSVKEVRVHIYARGTREPFEPCKELYELRKELNKIEELEEIVEILQKVRVLSTQCRPVVPVKPPIRIMGMVKAVEANEIKEDINELVKEIEEEAKRVLEHVGPVEIKPSKNVKIVVGPKGAVVEANVPVELPKARIEVDKNVVLEVEKNRIRMRVGVIDVNVDAEIVVEGNTIRTRTGARIIPPSEVLKRLRVEKIVRAELEEREGKPVYVVEGEEEGRLLGIFPVQFTVKAEIDAEKGEIIREEKPWWTFLVFG